jgi:hypothetical protein
MTSRLVVQSQHSKANNFVWANAAARTSITSPMQERVA